MNGEGTDGTPTIHPHATLLDDRTSMLRKDNLAKHKIAHRELLFFVLMKLPLATTKDWLNIEVGW